MQPGLPALGVAAGLAVMAAGLLRAVPPEAVAVPPGDLALVNGRAISQTDYLSQLEAQTSAPYSAATPQQRRQVLHDMVDEELTVQRSLALDQPETLTDVRHALVMAADLPATNAVLAARVSDATLRAYFRAHRGDYLADGTMRLRHLLLPADAYGQDDAGRAQAAQDAAEAAYQLRSGAAVDQVMQHFGLIEPPGADAGDQYDYAARQTLGPALYAIAEQLHSGDVSDPVERPDGLHLLLMNAREPPHAVAFERVTEAVYTAYKRSKVQIARAENAARRRIGAQILLAPEMAE